MPQSKGVWITLHHDLVQLAAEMSEYYNGYRDEDRAASTVLIFSTKNSKSALLLPVKASV